jgi:PAS domain S-box-containing protein
MLPQAALTVQEVLEPLTLHRRRLRLLKAYQRPPKRLERLVREPIQKPRFPWWLSAIVAVVGAAILATGILLALSQNDHGRDSSENDLISIGRLKADQIAGWRAERLGDAGVIAQTPFATDFVLRWLASGSADDESQLLEWFGSLKRQYGYANVRLVDPDGAVLLALDEGDQLGPAAREALQTAFTARRAVLTDLHAETSGGSIDLDSIAPLFGSAASGGQPLAAVILEADANDFLFPLVESWPTASKSAETLLVERRGESVVYLNDLRYQQGSALILELPLTRTDLPAVMAVLGTQGVVEGVDYRGVKVLAALQAVPDSPWFLVAKIDTAETFAGANTRTVLVIVVTALLLAAIGGTTAILWQRVLKKRYRQAYDAEVSRKVLAARYEHIVQQANDIILLSDANGRVVEANERAVEAYGYPREEIIGLEISAFTPPAELAGFQARMREIRQGGSVIAEADHQRKDGSVFPVEISSQAVVSEGKSYLQAIIRDLTERKKAEEALRERDEQLRQSQKMEAVGQLAGGIAHDFNNLLTAILGYGDLLLAGDELAEPAREDIEQIKRAAERAAGLTRQILAFSRRQTMRPQVVSLNEVLANMEPLLGRTLGEDIDLVSLPDPDLGHVEVDVHQFEQVLMNLALNARDAMPHGGRLTLETANVELDEQYSHTHPEVAPGKYVMLAVSDTGLGMGEETASRIFEPFFTTKGPGEGTGLGLATVYGTVKQSFGSISVYSEPGKGTCFKIYLPLTAATVETREQAIAEPTTPKGDETVLVVEDEPALRDLAVRVLTDHGFKVLSAGTAAAALQVLQDVAGEVDILVTDLILPGELQGKDLADQLLASRPDLPVVYMSGYTRNAIVHAGRLDHGVHFLEKPFAPTALVTMIREVLDRAPGRT